jgi:hypothetical protein
VKKVGANDPCPCGSGKKFKKCHRDKRQIQHEASRNQFEYPRGLPGIPQYMVTIARFKDPDDPRNQGGPQGLPGIYRAVMTLAKPGIPLVRENHHLPFEQLRGDSYLAIGPPAYRHPHLPNADRFDIIINTPRGALTFEGIPNDAGFLSQLQCEIQAADFTDALLRASRALAPALSDIAAQLDLPITIGQTDVIELRTGNRHTRLVTAPAAVPLEIPATAAPSEEFRLYAGLYREGLNSTSLRYQFLCYFKIIEAIRVRRGRVASAARQQGLQPTRIVERLPATTADRAAWLNALFPVRGEMDEFVLDNTFPLEVLGKKMSHVIDQHLRPIRLRITHAVLDSGELTLSPDEPNEERELIKWLPLAKCVARRMLKNDFPAEFLGYLDEYGTIWSPQP